MIFNVLCTDFSIFFFPLRQVKIRFPVLCQWNGKFSFCDCVKGKTSVSTWNRIGGEMTNILHFFFSYTGLLALKRKVKSDVAPFPKCRTEVFLVRWYCAISGTICHSKNTFYILPPFWHSSHNSFSRGVGQLKKPVTLVVPEMHAPFGWNGATRRTLVCVLWEEAILKLSPFLQEPIVGHCRATPLPMFPHMDKFHSCLYTHHVSFILWLRKGHLLRFYFCNGQQGRGESVEWNAIMLSG